MVGGTSAEAAVDFTGGIQQRIDIGDLKLDAEKRTDVKKLYHLLDVMQKQGDFVCCSFSLHEMVSQTCKLENFKKANYLYTFFLG